MFGLHNQISVKMDMWSLQLCIVSLIVVCVTHWTYKWRYPNCKGILPPGSSGLPLIGETLELIIPTNSFELSPFIGTRLENTFKVFYHNWTIQLIEIPQITTHGYGPIFRTNVAGQHVVVTTDAEVNNFILQKEGKLVQMWYLDSFAKVFKYGQSELGAIHKYFRGMALRHFGADCIKEKRLLTEFEELISTTLHSWSLQDSVEVRSSAAQMFLQMGTKLAFSCAPDKSAAIAENLLKLTEGFMCMPLNIPGTTFHKILKVKADLNNMFKDIVRARLASPGNYQGDLLDHVLDDMKKEFMTEDFIVEILFTLMFVATESASAAFSLALKFVSENHSVLQELTIEHQEVLRKRENPGSSITWEEYKSMRFTLQVINETMRIGFASPGFLRRAKKDFEINGYTIPAGWGIWVATAPVHLNPNTFKNPLEFNPWRWMNLQQDVTSKNFTPFGGGMRQCAGADYAKAFLSVFFHVLVTKYRWKIVGGGEIVQRLFIKFKKGLYIKVSKKQE